jgi:DNA-binding NarL/FixJ family response regulator
MSTEPVAILEDDELIRSQMARAIEEFVGGRVYEAEDRDKLLSIATDEDIETFLLDVDMGPGRRQEGLDACQGIKRLRPEARVYFYTGHAERYRQAIEELGACGLIPKRTDDVRSDMSRFAKQMKADNATDTSSVGTVTELAQDENIGAYAKLRTNREWLARYLGTYVAIVNGKQVADATEKNSLFEALRAYKGVKVFVTRVDAEKRVIAMPGVHSVKR